MESTRLSTKPFKKIAKIKERLETAEDLAFLPNDSVLVADRLGRKVKIFDKGGRFVKTLAESVKPLGISTNRSGLVAFTDVNKGNSGVQIVTQEGDIVNRWGDDLVWKPRSIEITNKGHLVITDLHAHARHPLGVYSMDGRPVLKFGENKEDNFQPLFMTLDPFDRVILGCRNTSTIKIYDSNNGKFLTSMNTKHYELQRRLEPRGMATDAHGNILVCDYSGNRLAIYAPDGRFINDMLDGYDGLRNPYSIAFSRSGYLAIGCNKSDGSLRKVRLYEVLQSAMHSGISRQSSQE